MADSKISVLDELRKKAEQKNAAVSEQESKNEKLEHVYKEKLLPKMQYLFDNLKETIEYLNFLEEPIPILNYSSQYPQFGTLYQKDYKINTDGRLGFANYNEIKQINVVFFCEGQGSFSYSLDSKSRYAVEKEIEFLHNRRLSFTSKKQNDGNCTQFTIKRKVPVSFRIEVEYEKSLLIVTINNHENLESFHKIFSPDELNDEFLDSLLSYFIRKDKQFIRHEISDNEKEMIQAALQQKQQALLSEEMNRDKKSSKIANSLKNFFSKDPKK